MPIPAVGFPLYDPRFEHDACGVGFVADAGGRSRDRVLPLALAGLASLGHRGAFAADGESSDGAGVTLPLEPALVRRLAPDAGRRPGIVMLFLPVDADENASARQAVEGGLAAEGLAVARWRDVPVDPASVGSEARASMPAIAQAVVAAPSGARRDFERRLLLARRRTEVDAAARGLRGFAVASASSRSVVYKGLVAGGRLAAFYRDLAADVPLSHVVFHQRYATNTHPTWGLAQPFRLIAHNGEINTVRGNREELRGRSARLGGRFGARVAEVGPLLTADGSDSLSLDEALDLLLAAGWRIDAALMLAIPEAPAMRSEPLPELEAFQRRAAATLSPWDGPAALVFSDGRRVGVMLDRNGLRPMAIAVTHQGIVTAASEAGAVPIAAADTAERLRLGPGEMLVVEPSRGTIHHDVDAKRAALATLGSRARRRTTSRPDRDNGRPDRRPDGESGRPDRRPDGESGRLDAVNAPPDRASGQRDVVSGHLDELPRRGRRFQDSTAAVAPTRTSPRVRWLAGLDAERLRLDIKTMVLEAHEPLWSMGDDTPMPALGRLDRRPADHLRQSFAQVTNPAIDPERERIVMDLSVELGRRPPLLSRLPDTPATVHLESPFVADLDGLLALFGRPSGHRRAGTLDATWDPADGSAGLAGAVNRLAADALAASKAGAELVVLSDRRVATGDRLAVPSVLGVGAVHTALTDAGLRGQTDLLADTSDVLDVHAAAMAIASGAGAVTPWLAMELAAELAGTRGAEELGAADTIHNLVLALEKGLRKVLARMGISAIASYAGGQFFEVLELAPEVTQRCFPAAPAWSGTVGFERLAGRQLRRVAAAGELPAGDRLPDPGYARFRADGEHHLYAPATVKAMQALAGHPGGRSDGGGRADSGDGGDGVDKSGAEPSIGKALEAYRDALSRGAATVRDQLALRGAAAPIPIDEVEPAERIMPRFVGAAMSLGALSPEAHQALTIGMRRIGASSNSGEGGEDPAWYDDTHGRHDTAIKQVASARFGVTATYLARAEQLEIKIAQGSKPGEGGQLPAKKVTQLIASLRRAQPGQSLISPPPHHDIYSIEDLAQLIADLRAINPGARIGVKLVAAIGIGTIAAGVAKAGADYIMVSGHAGGTGASPLSSIKHAGIPWELGLAEVHQVLMRNSLRDRVSLRADGGLQTGHDVLVAALLGAEEYGFGTAALVALGCDMARQCHLDTCPTGIATQREDLRLKFTGTPDHVERFFRALAEDVRHELAQLGRRSVAEVLGETSLLCPAPGVPGTLDLDRLLAAPRWTATARRRAEPGRARLEVEREPASAVERRLTQAYAHLPNVWPDPTVRTIEHADHGVEDHPLEATSAITTADRAFGAHVSGLVERQIVRRPIQWTLEGSAGQSFGAFAGSAVELRLVGQANDYVGKGLSGGTVVVRPEPVLSEKAAGLAIAGNTCLYGATGGRLHVVGRAGMRFAVRNSGATAVVEGVGAHGCEYMTGGAVAILGPVGRNLCAGMTGGRVYLHDPEGTRLEALDRGSARAVRLSTLFGLREDAADRVDEFRALLEAHRDAGSLQARRLLQLRGMLGDEVWLIEPVDATPVAVIGVEPAVERAPAADRRTAHGAPHVVIAIGS